MKWSWTGALVCTLAIGSYLTYRLAGEDKRVYLPGETSHGHYQIELKCESCHSERNEVTSDACLGCHAAELQVADDSHPPSKFLDPRNAALVAKLDARHCGTCHIEHRPMLTRSMGVTLPDDYCFFCHQDIGDERASHVGLEHDSCQTAGCHNFHDNRGLHEDFLDQHLNEPQLHATRHLPPTGHAGTSPRGEAPNADVPIDPSQVAIVASWQRSAHGRAKVNCSSCHGERPGTFAPYAGDATCVHCHEREAEGFKAGHHGMRLAAGLPPMRPEQARLPMTAASGARELGCTSCHGAHDFDRRRAAIESCLACHADEHSLAYRASPHARVGGPECGTCADGPEVTCATCHLPIVPERPGSAEHFVQHNQNDNLRPNEKMLRTVCIHCHGLGFSIDALADAALIRRNFRGTSSIHVPSLEWVERRRAGREAQPRD